MDEKGLEEIKRNHPFAKYFNCVRFLGGRHDGKNAFFKGENKNGAAICDFSEGIEYLKKMIENGYTPRIVLDNVPTEMLPAGKEFHRYGNTEPAKDYIVWYSYVKQFIQAIVNEFGSEEVSKWRFRVGTEPDLNPGHWTGTEEQWYRHYDWTVAAVTSVLPGADVGPGNILDPTANLIGGKYGLNIIDKCATGINYFTGKVGTQMPFFAMSFYGSIGDSTDNFDYAIREVKSRLAKYPQFNNIPIEVHEFAVLMDEKNNWIVGEPTEWGASWVAAITEKIYKHNIREVYQWFWASTSEGIFVPQTHVFTILEKMQGGKRLKIEGAIAEKNFTIGCLAGKRNKGYDLFVYRHESKREDTQPITVAVKLTGDKFKNDKWRFVVGNIIDKEHSGFYRTFLADLDAAGIKPVTEGVISGTRFKELYGEESEKLFKKNYEKYKPLSSLDSLAPLPTLNMDDTNNLVFNLNLTSHSVIYLRLEKEK